MTFGEVLLLVLAGGAFGGILDLFHKIEFKGGRYVLSEETLTFSSILLLLLPAVLIGAGGAIAILLLLTWAGRFSSDWAIDNVLFLLALSLVSGYAGRRLLPHIAARLEREIAETRKEAETAKEEAQTAKIWAKYSEALASALTAMSETAVPSDQLRAIEELSTLKDQMPTQRRVNILLGRIYKKRGELDAAIKTMTDWLEEKRRRGEATDRDSADALYNRACYYALKAGRFEDEEAKQCAYRDLAASISLLSENRLDAKSDPDFNHLREEVGFTEIVGDP